MSAKGFLEEPPLTPLLSPVHYNYAAINLIANDRKIKDRRSRRTDILYKMVQLYIKTISTNRMK